MKIQYCSDLHLEFPSNRQWLEQNPLIPKGDILLIGGDTHHLGTHFKDLPFFDIISEQFEMVFLIPGNHEFYGGYDASLGLEMDYELKIRDNIFLVNNTTRIIHDVEFIFTTLWSKIEKQAASVLSTMNDFRLIQFQKRRLNLNTYNELFDRSWEFLKEQISNDSGYKKVVVTHHLPSRHCNIERFKDSPNNEGFCTDLSKEIIKSQVSQWIYGHSHGNKPTFKLRNTILRTNQLGYVDYSETAAFRRDMFFEI